MEAVVIANCPRGWRCGKEVAMYLMMLKVVMAELTHAHTHTHTHVDSHIHIRTQRKLISGKWVTNLNEFLREKSCW